MNYQCSGGSVQSLLFSATMIARAAVLFGLALTITSCTPALSLALYNNTSTEITICNLHLRTNACQIIPAHKLSAVVLFSDEPAESFAYRVSTGDVIRTYHLPGVDLWNLKSPHRCKRIAFYCVAVQLEPNGSIYWIDAGDGLPRTSLPPQPDGFPLVPGA